MNYIKWIRQQLGHQQIILNFACGILTDDKNKVLLQRRSDKGTWDLPGGAIELGESGADTIKREFREETGLLVEPTDLIGVYSSYFDTYPNGDRAQTISILSLVKRIDAKQIKQISHETLELDFFSKSEIAKLTIVNQQHLDMLNDFFEDKSQVLR